MLVVALVVMFVKYRSLQRSFMAFANRGYNRADEEDDDVAVSFHPGEFFFHPPPLLKESYCLGRGGIYDTISVGSVVQHLCTFYYHPGKVTLSPPGGIILSSE